MEAKLLDLLSARHGHFQLESGHHGNLWLDLDSLFLRPQLLLPFARELARRLGGHGVEAIIGPLVGGAFLAQTIAAELGTRFAFAERQREGDSIVYRIPRAFHGPLRNKRVAVVDDAINAGSATRTTITALRALGAQTVAVGALLQLGDTATAYFEENRLPVERLAFQANVLWEPADCPLCRAHVPLSIRRDAR